VSGQRLAVRILAEGMVFDCKTAEPEAGAMVPCSRTAAAAAAAEGQAKRIYHTHRAEEQAKRIYQSSETEVREMRICRNLASGIEAQGMLIDHKIAAEAEEHIAEIAVGIPGPKERNRVAAAAGGTKDESGRMVEGEVAGTADTGLTAVVWAKRRTAEAAALAGHTDLEAFPHIQTWAAERGWAYR
jgi:hypothetical protein